MASGELPSSTSISLIDRARQLDNSAWERLCDIYGPLVYRWARAAGLQEQDAADLGPGISDDELKRFTQLTYVNLTDGQNVSGECFAAMPDINNMHVSNSNKLGEAGCKALSRCAKLHTLSLQGCPNVTDACVAHFKDLQDLRKVHLSSLPLSDEGVKHLSALPKLAELWVSNTQLTDAAVPELSKISTLRVLDLQKTHVTKAGVSRLQEALPQCNISHE